MTKLINKVIHRSNNSGFAMVLVLIIVLLISLWGARNLLVTKETIRRGKDRLRLTRGDYNAEAAKQLAEQEVETLFKTDGLDYTTGGYTQLDYDLLSVNDSIGYIFTRNRNSGGWQRCGDGNCLYKSAERSGTDMKYSIVIVPAKDVYVTNTDTLIAEYYVGIRALGGAASKKPTFSGTLTTADLKDWQIPLPNLSSTNSDVATYIAANGGSLDTRRYGFESRYFALPGSVNQTWVGTVRVLHNASPLDKWLFVPNEAENNIVIVNTSNWTTFDPIPLTYPNPCKVWVDPYWNQLIFVSNCPKRNTTTGVIPTDNGTTNWLTQDPALGSPMHTSVLQLTWDHTVNDEATEQPKNFVNDLNTVPLIGNAMRNVSLQDMDFRLDSLNAVAVDKFGKLVYIDMTGGGLNFSLGLDLCTSIGYSSSSDCEAADKVFNYVDGSGGNYNRVYLKAGSKAYASLVGVNRVVKFDTSSGSIDATFNAEISTGTNETQIFEGGIFPRTASANYGLLINNKYTNELDLGQGDQSGVPYGATFRKLSESSFMTPTPDASDSVDRWWENSLGLSAMTGTTHRKIDETTLKVVEEPLVIIPRFGLHFTTIDVLLNRFFNMANFSSQTTGNITDDYNERGKAAQNALDPGSLDLVLPPVEVTKIVPDYGTLTLYRADLTSASERLDAMGTIGGLPYRTYTSNPGKVTACYNSGTGNLYPKSWPCDNASSVEMRGYYALPAGFSKQMHCFNNYCSIPMTKIGQELTVNFKKMFATQAKYPGCTESDLNKDLLGGIQSACPSVAQPVMSRVAPNSFDCVSITNHEKLWYRPCSGKLDPNDSVTIATTIPTSVDQWITSPQDAYFAERPGTTSDEFDGAPVVPFAFTMP